MNQFLYYGFFGKFLHILLQQDEVESPQVWVLYIALFIVAIIFVSVKFIPKLLMLGIIFLIGGIMLLASILGMSLVLYILYLISNIGEEKRRRETEMLSKMSPEERRLYQIQKDIDSIKDDIDDLKWGRW